MRSALGLLKGEDDESAVFARRARWIAAALAGVRLANERARRTKSTFASVDRTVSNAMPRRDARSSSLLASVQRAASSTASREFQSPKRSRAISSGFRYSTPSLQRSTRSLSVTVVLPEPFGPAMTSSAGFKASLEDLQHHRDAGGHAFAPPRSQLAVSGASRPATDALPRTRASKAQRVCASEGSHSGSARLIGALTTKVYHGPPIGLAGRGARPGAAHRSQRRCPAHPPPPPRPRPHIARYPQWPRPRGPHTAPAASTAPVVETL